MENKKNVLILTSWYPSEESVYSGIFIQEQAKALSKDFNIIVVVIKVDYTRFAPFFKYEVKRQGSGCLKEYRLTVLKSFPVYNQFNFFAAVQRVLTNEFADINIDLIHSHVSYPAGVAGYFYSKIRKIPLIITEHYGGFTGLFRTWFHKKLALMALRNADSVTTVSRASKEIISRYIDNEIMIIPNMIDVSKFSIEKTKGDVIHAGFMGGLNTNVKGLDILLQAAGKLKKEQILFHIAGGGDLLEFYKQYAAELSLADKCVFYGPLKPEQTPSFYNRLDIFILPSRRESFGVVLLEALASGVPVIAARCGGPQEIVTNDVGILIEKENPGALAEGILKIIGERNSYAPERLRQEVDQRFGVDRIRKKMQVLYKQVMERK